MESIEHNLKEIQGGERIYPRFFNEASPDHKERYQLALNYIKAEDFVLDAACGVGYGSYYLAVNTGCKQVVGVDANTHALEWARTYFSTSKNSYYNVDLLGDFISTLPVDQFDVVTCFETIEHLFEDKLFLKKINSLLKPGGTFLISAPNEDIIPLNKNPFYKGGKNPHHHRHYTPMELKEILENSGFSIIDSFTQCPNQILRGENGLVIVYVCTNVPINRKVTMNSVDKGIEKLNLLRMREIFPFLATKASNIMEITKMDTRIDELIQSYEELMTAFDLINTGDLEISKGILENIDKSLCPESYFWIGLIAQTEENYFRAIEMYSKILDNKDQFSSALINFTEEQMVKTLNLL